MLRAVPITVRIADSRLVVLRSTSLILAISSTCFFVTLPTLLRFGSGTLGDVGGALEQHGGRRSLQNETKSTVAVHRYQHRENHPVRLFGGLGVELLAEIHDVQTVRAERRAHGRRGRGFPGG